MRDEKSTDLRNPGFNRQLMYHIFLKTISFRVCDSLGGDHGIENGTDGAVDIAAAQIIFLEEKSTNLHNPGFNENFNIIVLQKHRSYCF